MLNLRQKTVIVSFIALMGHINVLQYKVNKIIKLELVATKP